MKIKKSALLKVLTPLTEGIAPTPILMEGECFRFHDGTVSVYDGKLGYSCELKGELESLSSLDVFVNSNLLLKILRQIKSKNVMLEVDGDELVIKGKRNKGAVVAERFTTVFPAIPSTDPIDLPDKFCDGVNACQISVGGNNDNRNVLETIHFKDNFLESTNGRQASHYSFDLETSQPCWEDFCLSGENLATVTKHDIKSMSVAPAHVFFFTESYVIVVNRITVESGAYPNVSGLFFESDRKIVFDKDTVDALNLSKVFKEDFEETSWLKVNVDSHFQMMTASNSKGWFEFKAKKEAGDDLGIAFNPDFLKPILKYTNVGEVNENNTAITFHCDGFTYLFALLRKD